MLFAHLDPPMTYLSAEHWTGALPLLPRRWGGVGAELKVPWRWGGVGAELKVSWRWGRGRS